MMSFSQNIATVWHRNNKIYVYVHHISFNADELLFAETFEEIPQTSLAIEGFLEKLYAIWEGHQIALPSQLNVFLGCEQLAVKSWHLPMISKSKAKLALQHLLKKEMPVDPQKLYTKFQFRPFKFGKKRTVFCFSTLKEQLIVWEQACQKKNIALKSLSFAPLVMLQNGKFKDSVLIYHENHLTFLAKSDAKGLAEIQILHHHASVINSQNTTGHVMLHQAPSMESAKEIAEEYVKYLFLHAQNFFSGVKQIVLYDGEHTCNNKSVYNVLQDNFQKTFSLPLMFIQKQNNGKQTFLGKISSRKKSSSLKISDTTSSLKAKSIIAHQSDAQKNNLHFINFPNLLLPHCFLSFQPNFASFPVSLLTKKMQVKGEVLWTCVLVILLVATYFAKVILDTSEMNEQSTQYKEHSQELFAEAIGGQKKNFTMRQMTSILKQRTGENQQDSKGGVNIVSLINDINRIGGQIEGISIIELLYHNQEFFMKGTVPSYERLSAFVKLLQAELTFSNVEILESSINKNIVLYEIRIKE